MEIIRTKNFNDSEPGWESITLDKAIVDIDPDPFDSALYWALMEDGTVQSVIIS